MKTITLEILGSVAIVRLEIGVTNAINLDFLTEFSRLLKSTAQDDEIHGLVLISSNVKFFSIGFDLPALYGLPVEEFKVFYQTFNRLCLDLYAWPKPTAAALSGHTIAGGCILALCCDYRFIATGRKLIGLNEIKLGVPVPYPADRILREVVGGRPASTIMESGAFYPSDEALTLGLVDQIVDVEELERIAIEKVREIGSLSHQAFERIKQNRVEQVIDQLTRVLEAKENEFIECWYSPEARGHLADALTKF
jgi:enoyl-CoA hydratase/carnithine racemase